MNCQEQWDALEAAWKTCAPHWTDESYAGTWDELTNLRDQAQRLADCLTARYEELQEIQNT